MSDTIPADVQALATKASDDFGNSPVYVPMAVYVARAILADRATRPDRIREEAAEDCEQRVSNLSEALTSARRQIWEQCTRADAADARRVELETASIHPALAVDLQEHRNAAYKSGWDGGYAEGFAKASSLRATQPEAPKTRDMGEEGR